MQLVYTQNPAAAVEGLPYDIASGADFITAIASEPIHFGLAVAQVAGGSPVDCPPAARLTAAAGDLAGIFLGIVCNEPTLEADSGYALNAAMRVLRVGRIWVACEDTCTFGGAVFARVTAAGPFTQLGALRSDADAGNAVQIPGATWRFTTGSNGDLAIVELRP